MLSYSYQPRVTPGPACPARSLPQPSPAPQQRPAHGSEERILETVQEDVVPLDYLIGVAALDQGGYTFVQYRPTEKHKRSAGLKLDPVQQINMFVRTLRDKCISTEISLHTLMPSTKKTFWARVSLADVTELSLEPLWMIKGKAQLYSKSQRVTITIEDHSLEPCYLDPRSQLLSSRVDRNYAEEYLKLAEVGLTGSNREQDQNHRWERDEFSREHEDEEEEEDEDSGRGTRKRKTRSEHEEEDEDSGRGTRKRKTRSEHEEEDEDNTDKIRGPSTRSSRARRRGSEERGTGETERCNTPIVHTSFIRERPTGQKVTRRLCTKQKMKPRRLFRKSYNAVSREDDKKSTPVSSPVLLPTSTAPAGDVVFTAQEEPSSVGAAAASSSPAAPSREHHRGRSTSGETLPAPRPPLRSPLSEPHPVPQQCTGQQPKSGGCSLM